MSRALTGLTPPELAALLGSGGRPSPTRAKALMNWLYRGPGAALPSGFPAEVPNISKRILGPLQGKLHLPQLATIREETSVDGTVKLLLDAGGGGEAGLKRAPLETVMIPTDTRTTVCVSSQSGCGRGCDFCATAKMGILRNLKAEEIVAQVLIASRYAPQVKGLNPGAASAVRNVVFMGMGEPMDNLEEVLRAIEVLQAREGLGIAAKRITVSSVGVLPKMEEFLKRSSASLAISLNATTEEARRATMPVTRRWSLKEVLAFIKANATEARPMLVAYILMAGFNDSEADAQRLALMMQGLNVRVNLIPLNPHEGSIYKRPGGDASRRFHRSLMDAGVRVYIRATRGDEIQAACGQLNRGAA